MHSPNIQCVFEKLWCVFLYLKNDQHVFQKYLPYNIFWNVYLFYLQEDIDHIYKMLPVRLKIIWRAFKIYSTCIWKCPLCIWKFFNVYLKKRSMWIFNFTKMLKFLRNFRCVLKNSFKCIQEIENNKMGNPKGMGKIKSKTLGKDVKKES